MNTYWHPNIFVAKQVLGKHIPEGSICYISDLATINIEYTREEQIDAIHVYAKGKWHRYTGNFTIDPRKMLSRSIPKDIQTFIPLQVRPYTYYKKTIAQINTIYVAGKLSEFDLDVVTIINDQWTFLSAYRVPYNALDFCYLRDVPVDLQYKIIEANLYAST